MNLYKKFLNLGAAPRIGRKEYFLAGIFLFAVKYNLDRVIAAHFDKYWQPLFYFVQNIAITDFSLTALEGNTNFFIALVVTAIPFIYSGTQLTLARLRDAGLSRYWVFLFFVPFFNLILFLLLSAVPSQKENIKLDKTSNWQAILPKSRLGSISFAIIVSSIIAVLLTLLFVEVLGDYGWGLFLGVPFLLGFTTIYLYAIHNSLERWSVIKLSFQATLAFSAMLFILAMEGIICLLMGFPILWLLAIIGALVARSFRKPATAHPHTSLQVLASPLIAVLAIGYLEDSADVKPPLIPVTTEVEIKASQQNVWDSMIAFSHIDEPADWLFVNGIAYPTYAEIEGSGVGAVRYCKFTTGDFVEPITEWNEPYKLAFDVLDQPPPMAEWSFYQNLEITHLDGYFKSERGQFELLTNAEGNTILRGTTWYRHNIAPAFYWQLWSDYILHRIHLRVLNHIKEEVEGVAAQ